MQSGNNYGMHDLSGNVDDYNRSRRNRTPSGKMILLMNQNHTFITARVYCKAPLFSYIYIHVHCICFYHDAKCFDYYYFLIIKSG